jgi:hypothetical protein
MVHSDAAVTPAPCCRASGLSGRLLLMDRDPQAIAAAQAEFAADPRVSIRHANFSTMAEWDETAPGLDGVLLDLGVSSPQLDEAERGFSFMADAPLDMRMDTTQGESAADFLARATIAKSPTCCGPSAKSATAAASRARSSKIAMPRRSPAPVSWLR